MTQPLQLIGECFGRLLVHERVGVNPFGNALWHCVCDCGTSIVVPTGQLRSGTRTHCGCARPRKAPAPPRQPPALLYGYTWTPEDGVTVDPEAAAHVRHNDLLAQSGRSQRAIALAMDTAYPRLAGERWHQTQIGRMLTNRHVYRGGYQGKRQERWPVVLD